MVYMTLPGRMEGRCRATNLLVFVIIVTFTI